MAANVSRFRLSTPVQDFVLPPPSLESSRRETPARMQAVENVGNGFSRPPRSGGGGNAIIPISNFPHPPPFSTLVSGFVLPPPSLESSRRAKGGVCSRLPADNR